MSLGAPTDIDASTPTTAPATAAAGTTDLTSDSEPQN